MRALVVEEELRLYGLVLPSVLGQGVSAPLRTLSAYRTELTASWRMDCVLWPNVIGGEAWDQTAVKGSAEAEFAEFSSWLYNRAVWLHQTVSNWNEPWARLPSYYDVSTSSSYYSDVEYLRDRGIFIGNGDGTFTPDVPMSRAMVVTVLYRLAGSPAPEGAAPFFDVAENAWYAVPVAWASEQGIVLGYEDGSFRPDRSVSRQEFITLLHRSVGAPEADAAISYYPDAGSVAPWALPAVRWAVALGIYPGNRWELLKPDDPTARHEAATGLARYCRDVLGIS